MSRFRLIPLSPRDPREPGRTATTLELFFDLVFVIAVGIASSYLHDALAEGRVVAALFSYGLAFFAIWWAWMNFTWFATSFGGDDWLYRVLTFVQMGGVVVLAAGIEPAFTHGDFRVLVLSYVVMRVAMIAQWLRASRHAGELRATARRYALGIGIVQALWLLQLVLSGPIDIAVISVLVAAELAVPILAEWRARTTRHAHHITERYGLFTLIVLGETLLASANAIIASVNDGQAVAPLVGISALTLAIAAALWWIYFWPPHHLAVSTFARALRYGYLHYFVFASAAAFSAGVEVQIGLLAGHEALHGVAAAFTVTVPVAIFVLGIWFLVVRENADRLVNTIVPVGALVCLLGGFTTVPLVVAAAALCGVVVVLVVRTPIERPATPSRVTRGYTPSAP